jgi:hypothetical protein
MGQAEQRQIKTGVADRVTAEVARARSMDGRLAEIRRHRRELDEAQRFVRGHKSGVRGAVAMALLHADPPSNAAIANAAGWTLEDVDAYRRRLRGPREGPATGPAAAG